MATFAFSRLAEMDLTGIGSYTLHTWGASQTVRYIDELEACCRRLADHPALGRDCKHLRPSLRRMEQGQHVIFYSTCEGGILVCRILHKRMSPERYDMGDEATL